MISRFIKPAIALISTLFIMTVCGPLPKEYTYNLTCSREYTDYHEFIKRFREIIDIQTKDKIAKQRSSRSASRVNKVSEEE